jgi:polyhydroxybutyrate depolymerase
MESVPLGDRPFTLYVPSSYRSGTALPLLVLLHGYTSSGSGQERYLEIAPEAEKRGILYAVPDGTMDGRRNRFWNATDACCNFYGSTVDDATYLTEVIAAVSDKYSVDPARIYLAGHSNGAFMSFRMACDHADLIAAIAVLNGAMFNDASRCKPSRPLSVLNIRGDADDLIRYNGGQIGGNGYPSTQLTVNAWVEIDGCSPTPDTTLAPLDLASDVEGAETTVTRYGGCQEEAEVALWTIRGGSHVPAFTPDFVPAVLDFLLAQSAK